MKTYSTLPSVKNIGWAYREAMAELDRKQDYTYMAARLVRNDTELVFVGYNALSDAVVAETKHDNATGCWWCIAKRGTGIVAQGVVVMDGDGEL